MRILVYPLLFGLLLTHSFTLFAKLENNPTQAQQHAQLKKYYDSGDYFKEIQLKLNYAQEYLIRQVEHPSSAPMAIILDIDETALSNYQDFERLHFTRNVSALTAALMLGGAQAVPPVLSLYQYAIKNKVRVFFISERPSTPEITAVTVQNLKSAGYTDWEELILMPLDKTQSVATFKTNARRHIAAQGYAILMNIGDNENDIKGGYSEVKVKIPNPFYDNAV